LGVDIKLNGKIASIKRKHNPDRKLLPKISTLRCSKCKGYGHETHQCPNGDASPMIREDLKARARKKGQCKD